MIRTFTNRIAYNDFLPINAGTGLSKRQPENIMDFSSASADGLRLSVSVMSQQGTADDWFLRVYPQMCKWDGAATGAPNTSWEWYDIEDAQMAYMMPEGNFLAPGYELTNLSSNPTLETDATGWMQVISQGGSASGSHMTDGGYDGPAYRRMTVTSATTTPNGGQGGPSTPVTPGDRMTFGMAVRESRALRGRFTVQWNDGTTSAAPSQLIAPNTWTYGGLQVRVPAGKTSGRCVFQAFGSSGQSGSVNREVGDTQDVDAHLVAKGFVPLRFTDTTGSLEGQENTIAYSGSPLPLHTSRLIRGFGRFVALRFEYEAVNPSSDFGLWMSINAD